MKKIIKKVNGYEIKFDDRNINTNTHPYSIKFGKSFKDEYVFRSLKMAEKWANNH